MSSPRQKTAGSRRISSAIPSRNDSAMLSLFMQELGVRNGPEISYTLRGHN